jgi:hypothetical protein
MEEILTEVGKISQPGIHKLVREYQADLGEYIKDCYLEAFKQDQIERAKTCHPLCDEIRREQGRRENWHYYECTVGRKWTREEEILNQTNHRNCLDVHCDEPGYENRVVWIRSLQPAPEHGHYLRDKIMNHVLRKQIFADYEAQGQLRIKYYHLPAAEDAVQTAHQRKMTVILQDSGPLIKPPTKFEKFQRWRRNEPSTREDCAWTIWVCLMLLATILMLWFCYVHKNTPFQEITEEFTQAGSCVCAVSIFLAIVGTMYVCLRYPMPVP